MVWRRFWKWFSSKKKKKSASEDLLKLASISIFKHALNIWSAGFALNKLRWLIFLFVVAVFLHFWCFLELTLQCLYAPYISGTSLSCSNLKVLLFLTCSAFDFFFSIYKNESSRICGYIKIPWSPYGYLEWCRDTLTPSQSVSAYMLCTLGWSKVSVCAI